MSQELEKIRESYKPKKVKVLFVGESPPSKGTFFYNSDSNLYKCIHKAFRNIYGAKCGEGIEFLKFFKELGCYLDDLSHETINNEIPTERIRFRNNGIGPLAKLIREMQPKVIIIVMKEIEPEVKSAVNQSGLSNVLIHITPFPAFTERNKQRCVSKTENLLLDLISKNILTRI